MSTDHAAARLDRLERSPATTGRAITPIELVDLSDDAHHGWVAKFHMNTLPHGLFPRMGRRFVVRWHQAHMASPHGVGYVALRDGIPVGFALGSTDRAAHVGWILTHRRGALLHAALPALAVRPRLAASFLRTRAVAYVRRLARPTANPVRTMDPERGVGPVAVLEAVAVLPEARTQGIGTRLVDLVLADAVRAGAARVELVTKEGETGAAGFYERGSWVEIGRHQDRDGDGVLRFRIDPRRATTW